jgi:YesN/AraC family two-component response regulator
MLSARAPEDMQVGDGDKPEFYIRKPIDSEKLLTKINELLATVDSKKDEAQKKSDEQAQQWLKQHYVPGVNQGKGSFGT